MNNEFIFSEKGTVTMHEIKFGVAFHLINWQQVTGRETWDRGVTIELHCSSEANNQQTYV